MVLRVVENEIASYNFPEQPTVSVLLYTFEQAIRDWHGRRLVVTEAQMLCINQAALEAYWICDLVLRLQLPDQLFVRFFKTRQHEDAIKGFFKRIQEFLFHFIYRTGGGLPQKRGHTPSPQELNLLVCKTPSDDSSRYACATTSDTIASCDWRFRTLKFYACFFEHSSITDLLRQRGGRSSRVPTLDELSDTSTSDFLHEIVHLIGAAFWDEFSSSINCPQFQFLCEHYRINDIMDIPTYMPIHSFLQGYEDLWDDTAYGAYACEFVAQRSDGAEATLLNADNWAVFALEIARLYLTQAWEERWMRSGFMAVRSRSSDKTHAGNAMSDWDN